MYCFIVLSTEYGDECVGSFMIDQLVHTHTHTPSPLHDETIQNTNIT